MTQGILKSNYQERKPQDTEDVCGTIKVGGDQKCIYDEPKIKKDKYGKHQQDAVHHTDGIMSTIPGGTHGSTPHLTKIYCVDDGASERYQNKMIEQSPALKATRSNYEVGINGMKIRRLTPKECERLQGFPDNWTEGVSDTQRYKQCGNAVTVNVIKAIMEKLK